jgi:type IV pilus assembly protein PilM
MAINSFGLDIGRSFIKVAQVDILHGKKVLTNCATIPTPLGGIQSESPVDLAKVSDAIVDCLDRAKIALDRCVVSLIESQVVSRLIELPNLTDKELSAAIHWEAEQYIPLPMRDVNLQYKIVSRSEVSAGGKMSVLLVAVPKRVIEKYLNVARNAKLRPQALETESAALTRALTRPGDPPTIIVSMGAASTELVVACDGSVLFTRSIATGGISLTKAIMAEFNLPVKQAEEYKQTYGILEDKLSGKVASVLKPIMDILISEILKAMEFAHTYVQKSQVAQVVVCGGGAYLPGLSEFLAERTSIEVNLGDPWADFSKEGLILKVPGQGSVYAVATGLALRT